MSESMTPGRTVALTIDAVAHCMDFVSSHAQEAGFPIARVREVELVVEEVVANICKYSYGDGLGNVELVCRRLDGGRLELEFIDYGRPFDILAQPDPDLSLDIDQRDVGGIGVPMLRALINQASYRRDEERNVLMVIFEATPRFGGETAAT